MALDLKDKEEAAPESVFPRGAMLLMLGNRGMEDEAGGEKDAALVAGSGGSWPVVRMEDEAAAGGEKDASLVACSD